MKNTIKLSLTSALLLMGSLAQAEAPMEGFYAGVQAGKAKIDLSGDYSLVEPTPVQDTTHIDRSYDEVSYGVFAGHGWYNENTFYGVELGIDRFKDTIEDGFLQNANHAFFVENQDKYSLSGLYGKQLANSMLIYGRLGITYTDIEVSALSMVGNDLYLGSVHDWIGGTIGAGLAYPITDNLSVRGEYNYTTYFVGPKYDNDKNDGETTDYDFGDNRLMVGLSYSF